MNIIIDHHCSTPIYAQIVEQIKNQILYGELDHSQALPSIRKLSKELEVNSLTIQKALKLLETQGFLIIKKGVGAFINSESLPSDITAKYSLVMEELRVVLNKAKSLNMTTDEIQKIIDDLINEIMKEKK